MERIHIVKKSVTKLDVDCVVNAANEGLWAGGGVCGAIFKEAGYKSEFYEVLRYINQCLIKWVRRSYKKKNTRSRAEHWLGAVARRDRNLFAHWKFGILPSVGEGAV